jgi:hypothetical protein
VELKTFDPAYEQFLSPFSTKQVAIFSSVEKADTFIFYPVEERQEKIRHLERGFYDSYTKSVEYELTPGSYHYNMSSSRRYFYAITNKSSIDKTSAWLHFLELGYDEDKLNTLIKANPIIFTRSTARDSFTIVNQDHCIKDFKFEREKGIIEFNDCRGHVWRRK